MTARTRYAARLQRDLVDRDRLTLSLELHRRHLAQRRRELERAAEFVGDEDLPRSGGGAEPARRVDCVPDDRELHASVRADVPGERLADVETDADLQLRL